MIPDWVIEGAKILGPMGAAYLGTLRFAYKIGRRVGRLERETEAQTAELRAQSQQLEWQSRATEIQLKKNGSDPPPRPKLATLPDPFEGIVEQAQALNKRKR